MSVVGDVEDGVGRGWLAASAVRRGWLVASAVRRGWLVASAVTLLGCAAPSSDEPPVRVAAAASLAEVIPALATALDVEVAPRFGASSTLARQIRDGAESDVLVSADPRWVDDVIAAGRADASTRRVIATNGLVAIVPADAASIPRDPAALAALPHLAVAGPDVPAGAHARTALERSGVLAAARDHLVVATDVRAALAWVAQGEADGGIVYATDARAEPRVRVAFAFDPGTHDPIRYEAIALTPAGRALVARLTEARAQQVLAAAGFGAAEVAAPGLEAAGLGPP